MTDSARFQFALVACDRSTYRLLEGLCRHLESKTHMPRLADVPPKLDDASIGTTVSRALRNYVLPFAIVAVAGEESERYYGQKLCFAVRKRVPVMLVMSPDGFQLMKECADPCFSMGHPDHSQDVVGSILIGGEESFPGYTTEQFGRPHYVPPELWTKDHLPAVADSVRRLARGPFRSFRC